MSMPLVTSEKVDVVRKHTVLDSAASQQSTGWTFPISGVTGWRHTIVRNQ